MTMPPHPLPLLYPTIFEDAWTIHWFFLEDDEETAGSTLFVKNLSFGTTEEKLKKVGYIIVNYKGIPTDTWKNILRVQNIDVW